MTHFNPLNKGRKAFFPLIIDEFLLSIPNMKKYLPLVLLTPLVVLLDQLSKWIIVTHLTLGQKITVWEGYFDIVHVHNQGAAFGLFSEWNYPHREWFFYAISAVALAILISLYTKSRPDERRIHIPLALILGGAIGNLIDRLQRGEVVDFLRFHWHNRLAEFTVMGKPFKIFLVWPSFNIADAAITCGAIYLAIVLLFLDRKKW
jgi:signal peptidase II